MASVKDPSDRRRRRRKSMTPSPIMSELRIILLGKSLSQSSSVGNFILGRSAFETEDPPRSVELHCESVRGNVEGRDITIINTPQLYDLKLSQEELNQRIKECVSLSEPGPHAFLLVVQPHDFTHKDRNLLRYILNSFSDQAINYSAVINTDCGFYKSAGEGRKTAIHKLTEECHGRLHSFPQLHEWSKDSVCQLFEKIDQMVKDNGGEHLVYENVEDAEQSFKPDDELATERQKRTTVFPKDKIKTNQSNATGRVKRTEKEGMADQAPGDETDTQPVTEQISHTEEIGSKASQDREKIHNPHVDNEEDTEHCDNKDSCRQDCTDQTDTRLENQIPPGQCEDNEDTKKNNVSLRGEINSTVTSRHSQADENEDATGQEATPSPDDIKLHTEIKNEVTGGCLKTPREAPEHKQADGCSENIITTIEAPQEDVTEEMTVGASDLSVCDVECTSDSSSFTVVLFGNTSAVDLGEENILLGAEHVPPDQAHISRKIKVSGRALSVVNILDLHESALSVDSVDHIPGQLVNESNIQSFIFVLKLGQFTDDDKMGLEWLERKFGEHVLSFVMILFIYEREEECGTITDDLKNNTVLEQLMKKCGGRYCTCSKSMKNQSEMRTLLEKIDDLLSENNQRYYTAENYNTELKFKEHQQDTGRQKDHSTHLPQEKKVTHIIEELAEKGKEKMTESGEDTSKHEEKEKLEITKPEQLFISLNLNEKQKQKMKTLEVLQITSCSLHWKEPCTEKDLVETFLQRMLMMDYTARYITTKEDSNNSEHTYLNTGDGEDDDDDDFADFLWKETCLDSESHKYPVHPMDVQMAVFHCSDHFLKQLIVNKLAQCQYALPLLVPNPFTREIEFPLWTFRQIRKSWKITDSSSKVINKTQAISEAETPMVAFFRFGSASSSKSQLMNSLINEKHHMFFHRHCPNSSRNRFLLDGVVEIAWYCPSGKETDYFPDCVAFCNLHGDAGTNKEQLDILTEMSSVNVVLFSDPKNATYKEILQKLYRDTKPLICLLPEDESGVAVSRNGKYRISLKDRNQSDVAKNLRTTIKECFSKSPSVFKIEDLYKTEVITKDEDDPECKRGKEAAVKIMSQLEGNEVSKLKEKHLPCQGKLWHDWCEMNKDLHRLQGNNIEIQKSRKQREMKQIREEQHKYRLSGLMEQFISSLDRPRENEKLFFLKWVGILLDKRTSDYLSALHLKYNEKWTAVLDLKKNHDKSDKMKLEQKELEELSEQLNAATFGLEHIFREMGQIYESFISVQTHKKRSEEKTLIFLPKLAAELMKSGHPLELMDGDAAHVPVIWVSAVLDELVKILGDQRVFVLSVLGIQSSGKSTMLNAMFGLQFAVSAGRCTRGAFMQLVRVSEEMKEELKFDYILIVDTEGLRALELTGKSTQHHDNELATFVVGLGNLTLINIFGENPAEMQDILQIVVQAFLRMKKVRLNPSCIFVHQNVSDITASEKNMEGRRRLQEKLDEMTKLAAKEEESEAECFSDVIEFNVQDDVHYFAQLWEGSPPMAPPNPSYSRNIQNLKNAIFKKAGESPGMTLSQFKSRISDLWNALLHENFVFSFKNTLEIAVYRKLENEFGKWTWTLRSAMLDIEEKLYNRIENEKLERIEEKDLYSSMKKTKEEVDKSMKSFFEEDKDKEILIQWRVRCENKITQLHEDLVKDTKQNVNEVLQQQKARETFEHKRTQNDEKLFNLSKDLALKLKSTTTNEEVLKDEFDKLWDKWVTELTKHTPPERTFDLWEDAVQILSEGNEEASVWRRKYQQDYKQIDRLGDYSPYISKLIRQNVLHYVPGMNKPSFEDNDLVRTLTINVIQETKGLIKETCNKIARLGYKDSYIQEITDHVRKRVEQHHRENQRIKLRKEFTLDLSLHVCELASHRFTECHKQFRVANDPRVYLSKQKPQYYSVFTNYCRGATTTKVFGELICSNLRESILQAVYNKTATDLASQIRSDMPEFNGNRSNLEKHVLKCLAEEENFERYKEYIHNPRKHFEHFITEKVNKYITENDTTVLNLFKGNLKDKIQRVRNAVHTATEEVKNSRGDADMWLRSFTSSLKDELSLKEITFTDHKEITDFDFLQQRVSEGLTEMMSELYKSFNSVKDIKMEKFRKKPDEILIEHLCRCCWVQCPFCKAICTNTMEDHDGDHSVPFHRVDGINGTYYRDTTNLDADFCTTLVQSCKAFYPRHDTDVSVPFKSYRTAGGVYATWSITPDNSQLAYWKWFVCKFQKDLEKHYEKTFQGEGEIPREWRDFTKEQAVESLDKYI
ncbi:interferon-induced very large GTPase 1 isoform X2 [Pangasianodon hypophthalmus]|uniref:interferon-induced very large GTPase 1 isoform X2 n=1 Tax=Pangasianodon hypophthalmus TaxID=310915 RepID=UPI002308211D|nr:interferon-induced very large GTPase 1 isoform X2 [Pangasianodon hypophthalmus]